MERGEVEEGELKGGEVDGGEVGGGEVKVDWVLDASEREAGIIISRGDETTN